ncbi:MAG TPA: cytochrome d ubiquinol oxidase subunit II [Ignavibacteriaceae bacterium]|nr:cytochrome d ubiquinol oxidase subunit II [Ignavibacteriaceae bacterium]
MLSIVIIFLLISVYLYCLLGGADFGAGIIELFTGKTKKERVKDLVTNAMAPIWEANHMWVIITVVILFMAFPGIYTQVSISLYIPLIILLIGVVLRGTAFTFRHYDAVHDHSQVIYSRIFAVSSLLVSFFFGLIIGALVSGKITVNPTSYFEGYLHPWINLFSISTGIFICSLFAFIASVFLVSESTDQDTRELLVKQAKLNTAIMVLSGAMVFIFSFIEGVDFAQRFFRHPASIAAIILATIALPFLWRILNKGLIWTSRIIAGAQLFFILAAFYFIYFPEVILLKEGSNISLYNAAAPDSTLKVLGWALIIGSFIIFPTLFYLFKVFKIDRSSP